MKNTKNAILYGVAGGAIGYGVCHFLKTKKNWTMLIVAVGAVAGGYLGNES